MTKKLKNVQTKLSVITRVEKHEKVFLFYIEKTEVSYHVA